MTSAARAAAARRPAGCLRRRHFSQRRAGWRGRGSWWLRMGQGGEVDRARRLAARAPDFEPWVAAVDGLVDRGRRVDRAVVRPHALIPALTKKVIGFSDQGLTGGALLVRSPGRRSHQLSCASLWPVRPDAARTIRIGIREISIPWLDQYCAVRACSASQCDPPNSVPKSGSIRGNLSSDFSMRF
jgi:hypothetical protein